MKIFLAAALGLLLVVVANPAAAQTSGITDSLGVGPCNPPYSSQYYCYSIPTYATQPDGTQVQDGYVSFDVTVNADGSFSGGQVWLSDLTGAVVLSATDWTGADFQGSFSGTRADGTPFTGTLTASVSSYQHREGGGRVGVRIVTSWHVTAGTLAAQ